MKISKLVPLLLSLATVAAPPVSATTFVKDVRLIGGTKTEVNNLKTNLTAQGWTFIDYDLNKGCGSSSDYIYLLYKAGNTPGGNSCYGYVKTADDTADLVLVTQSGSVQEGFVNDQISKYKDFKLVSSMTDGFLMVAEGKADACACDINNGQLYAEANGGLAIAPFRFVVDESTQGTRVGIPKGEDELTAFIDQCIDELRAEGTIDKWYDEYSDYARTLGVD